MASVNQACPRVMAAVQDESELTAQHLAGSAPDLSFCPALRPKKKILIKSFQLTNVTQHLSIDPQSYLQRLARALRKETV